jgi:hypothetical protein
MQNEPIDAEFEIVRRPDAPGWGERVFVAALCLGFAVLWKLFVHPWFAHLFG